MTALPAVDPMALILSAHSSLKVALQYHADDADRHLRRRIEESFALLEVIVSAHWRAEFGYAAPSGVPDVPANKRAA